MPEEAEVGCARPIGRPVRDEIIETLHHDAKIQLHAVPDTRYCV